MHMQPYAQPKKESVINARVKPRNPSWLTHRQVNITTNQAPCPHGQPSSFLYTNEKQTAMRNSKLAPSQGRFIDTQRLMFNQSFQVSPGIVVRGESTCPTPTPEKGLNLSAAASV